MSTPRKQFRILKRILDKPLVKLKDKKEKEPEGSEAEPRGK